MVQAKKVQTVLKSCRVKCGDCKYDVTHPAYHIEEILSLTTQYQDGACPSCGSHNIEATNEEKVLDTAGCYVAPWQDPRPSPSE